MIILPFYKKGQADRFEILKFRKRIDFECPLIQTNNRLTAGKYNELPWESSKALTLQVAINGNWWRLNRPIHVVFCKFSIYVGMTMVLQKPLDVVNGKFTIAVGLF